MFLTRKTPLSLIAERGSSLLAVIGLMAVAGVATLAIAGSTMTSLGVSSATRAGVQAQSAAEAGLDAALLNLTSASCTAPTPPAHLAFTVTITQSVSTSGDDWAVVCPISDAAKRVKIVSVGKASQVGRAGNTSGDERTVEAIYAYTPKTAAVPASAGDTAIYSYDGGGFGFSSQLHWKGNTVATDVVVDPNAPRPVVRIRNGDANCGSPVPASTIFEADIVVENGSFYMGGSCIISGNVRADGDLRLVSSSQIFGSAWATDHAIIGGSTWIHNNLTAGKVSGSSARIKGTVTEGTTGIAPPDSVAAEVPDWVDVGYKPELWPDFDVVRAAGCTFLTINNQIRNLKKSAVIDARDCPAGVVLDGVLRLELPADVDVVIYAEKFSILGSANISGKGDDNKLWLITPDEVVGDGPTCRKILGLLPNDSSVLGSFIVEDSVAALIYSPCTILMGFSAQWNGQFYGGTVYTTGSSQLDFVDIGIPGTAISAGATPGSAAEDAKLGARISIRDLNG